MTSQKFSFKKSERITSLLLIKELFDSKSSVKSYPIVGVWLLKPEIENHQVLIAVSKRLFRKAVDRNRIKRQMREAWRLNKHLLKTKSNVIITLKYISKHQMKFQEIEQGMLKTIQHLNENA